VHCSDYYPLQIEEGNGIPNRCGVIKRKPFTSTPCKSSIMRGRRYRGKKRKDISNQENPDMYLRRKPQWRDNSGNDKDVYETCTIRHHVQNSERSIDIRTLPKSVVVGVQRPFYEQSLTSVFFGQSNPVSSQEVRFGFM
jgi:hypothetical protein